MTNYSVALTVKEEIFQAIAERKAGHYHVGNLAAVFEEYGAEVTLPNNSSSGHLEIKMGMNTEFVSCSKGNKMTFINPVELYDITKFAEGKLRLDTNLSQPYIANPL